jgi:hypothetical protein
MSAGIYHMVVDQGADLNLKIEVSASDNTPIDLTGFTARGQIRATPAASVVLASFTTSGSFDSSGSFYLQLANSQSMALPPKKLYYDLEISSGTYTYRLLSGTVTVNANVTR